MTSSRPALALVHAPCGFVFRQAALLVPTAAAARARIVAPDFRHALSLEQRLDGFDDVLAEMP